MARVPELNVPEVTPQDRPISSMNIPSSPAMFGGTIAQAEEKAGGTMMDINKEMFATNMRIKENQADVEGLQAGNGFYKYATDQLQDFKSKQGMDAVNALKPYQDGINDYVQHTADDLSPIARARFLSNVDIRAFNLQREAVTYADGQARVAKDKEFDAGISLSSDAAAKDPWNMSPDGPIVQGSQAITKAWQEKAALHGYDEETAEAGRQKAMNKFDLGIMQNRVQSHPISAKHQLLDPDHNADPYLTDEQRSHLLSQAQMLIDGKKVTQSGGEVRNNPPMTSDFNALVDKYADQNKIPRSEAYALFGQESSMNPKVPNGDGGKAVGPGQLHSAAAQEMGLTDADRNDTEKNVAASVGYYAKQRAKWGTPEKAYAAYNAGPGSMEAAGGDITKLSPEAQQHVSDFSKRLPIAKTLGAMDNSPVQQTAAAGNIIALTPPSDDLLTLGGLDGPSKGAMQQAIDQKNHMLSPSGDPAGYLASKNMDFSQLVEAGLHGDAQAFMRAGKESDLMYDSLHVDPSYRPMLPADTADMIAEKLHNYPLSQQMQGLQQLRDTAGNYGPRIMSQLARTEGISSAALIGMDIPDPALRAAFGRGNETMTAAEGGAKGATVKKDFSALIPNYASANKSIDTALATSKDWRQFIGGMPLSGVPDTTIGSYNDGVKQLAMQLMLEQRIGPDAAAEKATKAFTDQYKFIDDARVPKEVYTSVKRNADIIRSTLKADDLFISNVTSDKATQEAYMQRIKLGKLVSLGDNTGAAILNGDGEAVRRKDGSMLTIPYNWPAQGHAAGGG